jgi:hypothetical protein
VNAFPLFDGLCLLVFSSVIGLIIWLESKEPRK